MERGEHYEVEQHLVLRRNHAGQTITDTETMEMFVFEIDEINETALLVLTDDSKAELPDRAEYEFEAVTVPRDDPERHRYVERCERIED